MKKKCSKKCSNGGQLLFRKFSRKGFAAFSSMHKVVRIGTLAACYSLIVSPLTAFAQSDSINSSKVIEIEEVEITGQKDPKAFEEIPRMITVVTSKEIECAPSQSISDLLRYTGNIDIRQRGKSGIQSDISIRGGSFDQSMVLFNGVNITDPQTGHLSLFLPADIEIIKKIEILNGSVARIYGANAFSGAVNFVTYPADYNFITASSSMGEFGYVNNTIAINLANKKVKSLLYAGTAKSDGYKANTDFKRMNVFYQQLTKISSGSLDFQFGYTQRAFGANSYYTPAYPDQYEVNKMIFSALSYTTGKVVKFNPKIYWRRHYDRFELFREDADWYRLENDTAYSNDTSRTFYEKKPYKQHNHHINDILGCELNFATFTKLGESGMKFHLRSENIYSTNIGLDQGIVFPVKNYPDSKYTKSNSRTIFDISLNHQFNYSILHVSGGFLLNWNSFEPDEMNIFPGIDLIIDLTKNISAVTSYNYTLGLPTFTDLYYQDPGNTGNNELIPYSQQSFEGGFKANFEAATASVQYYYNQGSDVIDWVWIDSLRKFKPLNIDNYKSQGIEATTHIDFKHIISENFPLQSIRLNYSFIDMDKDVPGKISKYSYARQMFSSMVLFRIFKGFMLSANLSYLDRVGSYFTAERKMINYIEHNFKPYLLIDIRLSYTYKLATLFLECTNLTDKEYVDAGSINQPGRWITGGVRLSFSHFKL